jgi:hypothetical protein
MKRIIESCRVKGWRDRELEDAQGLYIRMTDKPPGMTRCSFGFWKWTHGASADHGSSLDSGGVQASVLLARRRCVDCCGSLGSMEYCSVT